MKTIHYARTLFYYDGIQVFEGEDAIGGAYIGALAPSEADSHRYVVVGVRPESLRDFRMGAIDLRTILTQRPEVTWYFASSEDGAFFQLADQEGSIEEANVLPEDGFVLHENPSNLSDTLQEARGRNNLVVSFAFDPPEAARDHRIHAETLGRLLTQIQSLVKHAYHAALKAIADTSSIDRTDGYSLDVISPAGAGSFKIVMEAVQLPDLLGQNEVSRALQQMDYIFAAAHDPAIVLERLKTQRGHFAGSFLKLLQTLQAAQTGMSYGWASPTFRAARTGAISGSEVGPLVEVLSEIKNLGVEQVKLTGKFSAVNVTSGTWTLEEDGTDKKHHGKTKDGGPTLGGITVKTRRYQIHCDDVIEETQGTGREQHVLYITKVDEA